MPRMKAPTPISDRHWQAEEALHIMTRAEEIKRDAALMRDVKRLAADKQKVLSSVTSGSKTSRPARSTRK